MDERETNRMNRLNASESFSPDVWNDPGVNDTGEAFDIREVQNAQEQPGASFSVPSPRSSRFRVGITALVTAGLALAVTVMAVMMNVRDGVSLLRRNGLLSDDGQTDMIMRSEDALATGVLYDMTSVYSGASSDTEIVTHLSGGSVLLIYDVYGQ